jgi:Domain of unknown function (DUF4398)
VRSALFCLLVGAGSWWCSCAQAPTHELEMTTSRVEAARSSDAPEFAPDLFAEAESSLAEARRLVDEGKDYRGAIQAMALASLRADEASVHAREERRVVERKLRRLLIDLESLLEIAVARGADGKAPSELAGLRARYESVRDLAMGSDLLEAMEAGRALRPEVLAFEERFRP